MSFLGNLFSGKAPQIQYTPPNFSGGGLNATFGGNGYSVSADPNRAAAVGGVAGTFAQQANALGNLAGQWTPGFSNLRTSLMSSLQNNRTQALGNLRENLSSRRVLGSSFAQDTLARADQEYQQQIEKAQADTFLQELSANQQIIQQQYTASRGAFQTGLDELNLEADLASKLTTQASSALANVATAQAQLDAKAQAGAGAFFGNLISGGISKAFGGGFSGIGSFFGGGAGGGGSTSLQEASLAGI